MDGEVVGVPEVIAAAAFRAELRKLMRATERVARANRLTPQRYLLLLAIKGAPDRRGYSTVTELCERMQLHQSSVSEMVQRAVEAGLVEREASHKDARVTHLHLTPEGNKRLSAVLSELAPQRRELLRSVLRLASDPG